MDNVHFDITLEGDIALEHALAVAFAYNQKAKAWRTDEYNNRPRLLFSWQDAKPESGWIPFVTPIEANEATTIVQAWLEQADYGPEPDGSNGRGWRVYCDRWGKVEPYTSESFVAIEPQLACYGK